MKQTRTAKIKLNILEEQILPTLLAYTKAYNFVCKEGYKKRNFNGVSLHKETYQFVREYLPSQLAISSRMKATESLSSIFKKKRKILPKCPQSKLCSIRYDKNSYSLFIERGYATILTINGRLKTNLDISDYHKKYLDGWRYTSTDLCIKDHKVYLHIIFEKEIPDRNPTGKLLGIDRGINNIAVTSDNKFYSGKQLKKITNKYRKLRSSLQSKGTKSAKRHLKKLSGKERRFKADINHQVSKKIIENLHSGDSIVLEKLSGIRNKRKGKVFNTILNSWNFYQLEQFILYKAASKGIFIEYIDPRYTSQHCLRCGNIRRNNRTGTYFECKLCHFKMNADLVASKNIILKYLGALRKKESLALQEIFKCQPKRVEVNQPIAAKALL